MNFKTLKKSVQCIALIVFLLCLYAYLVGNRVFRGGFENDAISWYILAKGIFCSTVLLLLAEIVELVMRKKR